jgi:predicted outer membrane protein
MTKSDELKKISIIGIESISSEGIARKLEELRDLTKNHIEKMSKDTNLTPEKRQKLEAIKTRVEAFDDQSLDPKQQAMKKRMRELGTEVEAFDDQSLGPKQKAMKKRMRELGTEVEAFDDESLGPKQKAMKETMEELKTEVEAFDDESLDPEQKAIRCGEHMKEKIEELKKKSPKLTK